MSEFIAVCPKCRQQILCDTAYIGKRIACPVCLQEISMPAPSQQETQAAAQSASPSPRPSAEPAQPAAKGKPMTLVAVVGGVAVVLAVVAVVLLFHKGSPSPQPSASGSAPATAAPAVAAGSQSPATATPSPQPAAPTLQAPASQCRAIWTFDQDNGNTVNDSSGNNNNAVLVGDKAVWTKSAKVGTGALSLGGSSYAETPGPVVDSAQSFSVTAWVNIAGFDKQHNQTVVSIDGSEISGFYLMVYHMGPRFAFNRSDSDDRRSERSMASSSFNVSPNTWYHLAGVNDADAKTLSLYVNGKLEETVPYEKGWQALGKTAIGRGYYGHTNVDFLNGTVDEVRVYSYVLSADEIKKLAK